MYISTLAIASFVAHAAYGSAQETSSPTFNQPGTPKEVKYFSEFTIITAKSNFVVKFKRLPNLKTSSDNGPSPVGGYRGLGGNNPNYVLGSSIFQSGNVFRANSVNLVEVLGNFAGGRQPETTPDINSAFTFNGECVATAGKGIAEISAHTCLYNLCLRGSQNCINIYAGTRFDFNAFPAIDFTDDFDVNRDSTNNPLSSLPPVLRNNKKFQRPLLVNENIMGSTAMFYKGAPARNPLPPSFPGVIIGGTNDFEGITGNIELVTVAGSEVFGLNIGPPPTPTTQAPSTTPSESPSIAGDSESPSLNPTFFPTFDGTQEPTAQNTEPAIVQKLFIKSNIKLPKAPKATQAKNTDSQQKKPNTTA